MAVMVLMSDEDVIEFDEDADPTEIAPWYEQFLNLPEKQRIEVVNKAMKLLEQSNPDTYRFIKKFRCKLVGITPRVEYALVKKSDGGDTDVSYVHSYSMPTLLFWCDEGKFHFSVNPNLDYNDTVLNRVKGNRRDREIKGFTG